jgi:hypothetical protein
MGVRIDGDAMGWRVDDDGVWMDDDGPRWWSIPDTEAKVRHIARYAIRDFGRIKPLRNDLSRTNVTTMRRRPLSL